jgi:hypothetical protein
MLEPLEHDYYKSCDRDDCDGSCPFCTLAVCKVCGLCEGALTTHCPGERVEEHRSKAVYAGKIDFVDGSWEDDRCSHHSPEYARPYSEFCRIMREIYGPGVDLSDTTDKQERFKIALEPDDMLGVICRVYRHAYAAAVKNYAVWFNGEQYVGVQQRPLKKVLDDISEMRIPGDA